MTRDTHPLPAALGHSPVQVLFGSGLLNELGTRAASIGASRVLLVTDPGIVSAGHVKRAEDLLRTAGIEVVLFDGVRENPTTRHVELGLRLAVEADVDLIIGLGGGSSLDCAKGINLLLTNGGRMADYRGDPSMDVLDQRKPLLPMFAVPTTAGTGSEAQSFALICDSETGVKMACGDRRLPAHGGLRPMFAILDPDLTRSQPPRVAAAAGIDAAAHAVETAASTRRNPRSLECSMLAWTLINESLETSLLDPDDENARATMLLGSHVAGIAIELSMLGAAHACANPLTARHGIVHGFAVGALLPHVVRFNAANGTNPYEPLGLSADDLAARLNVLLEKAAVPRRLCDWNIQPHQLAELANEAAQQWTARFNPRHVQHSELLTIFQSALN